MVRTLSWGKLEPVDVLWKVIVGIVMYTRNLLQWAVWLPLHFQWTCPDPIFQWGCRANTNTLSRAVGGLLEVGQLRVKSMHLAVKQLKIYQRFTWIPLKTWPLIYVHGKYGGIDQAYSPKLRPGGSKTALVWLFFGCLYTRMPRIWLGGSGGMLPQESLMLWDGFWGLFLGLKTSLGILHFSLSMETKFASQPHGWRLLYIGIEQCTSRMCGFRAHNVLVLKPPQFSFMLGPWSSCGHKSVLAICVFLA